MAFGKKELVAHLAQTADLSQEKAAKVVDEVLVWIRNSLKTGENVRLMGLGTFAVQKMPARDGRNLQTGETIKLAERNRATFKSGEALKEALNSG